MRTILRLGLAAAALAVSACAGMAPGAWPEGTPIDAARGSIGGPTGEYALPDGGTRLEFARGAWGRQTWMLDFDAEGRLVRKEQVLTEAHFAAVRPGMSAGEVRMRLGRPADVQYIGWQKLTLWGYRWWPGDCVIYQVSIDAAGSVTEAGMATDLACGGPNLKGRR